MLLVSLFWFVYYNRVYMHFVFQRSAMHKTSCSYPLFSAKIQACVWLSNNNLFFFFVQVSKPMATGNWRAFLIAVQIEIYFEDPIWKFVSNSCFVYSQMTLGNGTQQKAVLSTVYVLYAYLHKHYILLYFFVHICLVLLLGQNIFCPRQN